MQELKDQQLERRMHMKQIPRKILELLLKQTKHSVEALNTKIVHPSAQPLTTAFEDQLLSRKRVRTAPTQTEEEEIRLLKPENGKMIYTPQEAAHIGYHISNDDRFDRTYKRQYKEAMIAQCRVPCQMT